MSESLKTSFHPYSKDVQGSPKKFSAPEPTQKEEKVEAKSKSPAKKATRKPKKRPLSQPMRDSYAEARNRARVSGGFLCEFCGSFVSEGQEHAHHIVYGRLNGTRAQHTIATELAIVGGDWSQCKCHTKIHKEGIKDPMRFRLISK